jgi:hypothetical protein
MQKLLARRIRTGSIYRLVAIGTAVGAIPLCTLFGVLASFNLMTLKDTLIYLPSMRHNAISEE